MVADQLFCLSVIRFTPNFFIIKLNAFDVLHTPAKALLLNGIQLLVKPVLLHQFTVRSLFYDFTIVQHDDFVGFCNGAKPVSNDENSFPLY